MNAANLAQGLGVWRVWISGLAQLQHTKLEAFIHLSQILWNDNTTFIFDATLAAIWLTQNLFQWINVDKRTT